MDQKTGRGQICRPSTGPEPAGWDRRSTGRRRLELACDHRPPSGGTPAAASPPALLYCESRLPGFLLFGANLTLTELLGLAETEGWRVLHRPGLQLLIPLPGSVELGHHLSAAPGQRSVTPPPFHRDSFLHRLWSNLGQTQTHTTSQEPDPVRPSLTQVSPEPAYRRLLPRAAGEQSGARLFNVVKQPPRWSPEWRGAGDGVMCFSSVSCRLSDPAHVQERTDKLQDRRVPVIHTL